jgi:hypothetical protein
MSIVDTATKSARGVEVIDTNQQRLTPTSTCRSELRWEYAVGRAHIESTGRKAFVARSHVLPAFGVHRLVDPTADELHDQHVFLI